MSDLRTAAKQALEALLDDPNKMVQISEHHWESKRDLAVIAIRAALAHAKTTCAASGCNYPQGECLGVCRSPRPAVGETVSLDVHDRICQDLYRQIRGLILDNEKLRAELNRREQRA